MVITFLLLTPLSLVAQTPAFPSQQNEADYHLDLGELTGMNRIELTGGYGEKTDNFRITAHWSLFSRTIRHFDVDFSLAFNYSVFDGESSEQRPDVKMHDLGVTPTATLYFKREWAGFRPFLEGGIGLHYLTDKQFSTKDFSTNFQFGDHIGVGVQFGAKNNLRLGYQFQHLSNAGIDSPNPGINFHLLNLGVRFN